ncbi:MAG: hypothetical protein NTX03_07665 [Bacteroidetes bacterium]|nr:hypothetical protein [Bacteroidota bacterium]
MISLTLYVIISLSYPFNGASALKPEPFEWIIKNTFVHTDSLDKTKKPTL